MKYSNFDSSGVHQFDGVPSSVFEPLIYEPRLEVEDPSFSIPKLSKIRTKIYNGLLDRLDSYETILTPRTLEDVSVDLCRILEYPIYKKATILGTLSPIFKAKPMTTKLLYIIATKFAGNLDLVLADNVIPRWEDINIPIWVAVEIVGSSNTYGFSPGKEIKCFITGGLPSGMTLTQRVSNKFIQHMLREIGFPKYQKFDAANIYNTRFSCNILKSRGVTKMVAFHVSSSQSKHNKTLYKIRHGECPFKLNKECVYCMKGLVECPGSLHRDTFEVGDCVKGHRGIMKPGNKKCNACIELAKQEAAQALLERRSNKNE